MGGTRGRIEHEMQGNLAGGAHGGVRRHGRAVGELAGPCRRACRIHSEGAESIALRVGEVAGGIRRLAGRNVEHGGVAPDQCCKGCCAAPGVNTHGCPEDAICDRASELARVLVDGEGERQVKQRQGARDGHFRSRVRTDHGSHELIDEAVTQRAQRQLAREYARRQSGEVQAAAKADVLARVRAQSVGGIRIAIHQAVEGAYRRHRQWRYG